MVETENTDKENKSEKKSKGASFKSILGGDILAGDFFRRQSKQIGRAHV